MNPDWKLMKTDISMNVSGLSWDELMSCQIVTWHANHGNILRHLVDHSYMDDILDYLIEHILLPEKMLINE